MSAEPADDLADLLDPLLRKVFDAAEPALVEVTFLGVFVWDNAEPAADFAALLDPLFLRTLDAADAAFLLVTSVFLLITNFLCVISKLGTNFGWRGVVVNEEGDDCQECCK